MTEQWQAIGGDRNAEIGYIDHLEMMASLFELILVLSFYVILNVDHLKMMDLLLQLVLLLYRKYTD